MIIDPAAEKPQNIYKLLIGSVVPRPIAFVSTLSERGVRNLAPFSFFTVASANPPVVCFVTMVENDGSQKDTLVNVRATGEFVVNIVSESFAEQMNLCSGDYPPETDEFAISGLNAIPSTKVRPPRVAESLISMECTLRDIHTISTEPMSGNIVLGNVLCFHVDESLITDFRIDPDKLNAIGRMGGPSYTRTKERFEMARPTVDK